MLKFGKTYWVKQFLNALENIDFNNRLPRGRSYASNGKVKKITIKKNEIDAEVKGTQPLPYKIKINIPKFTAEQKDRVTRYVVENPMILAALLNR